jgi:DtxR family Mn-dependent transcriptional regulator
MFANADTLSPAIQDYLKAIYALTRSEPATGTLDIARMLQITPASVSNMLQKMDENQPRLVDYHKRHGVALTMEGEHAALRVLRRHRLIEEFLVKKLGYTWDQVHDEADRLEHAISPFLEERIALSLGDPSFDPHGDPIPDQDLHLPERRSLVSLTDVPASSRAVIRWVNDQRADVLAYLGQIGICPGAQIEILRNNPLEGAVQIQVAGQSPDQILGERICDAVMVELLTERPAQVDGSK